MGKVTHGAIVIDIRGVLSSLIYARNKGGAYTRPFKAPFNPKSQFQTIFRNNFKLISQLWSDLNQYNRDSFNSLNFLYARYNKFGDLVTPSGKQLFQRLNQNLLNSGQPINDFLEAPRRLPKVRIADISYSLSSGFFINIQGSCASSFIILYATLDLSTKVRFIVNHKRFLMGGACPGNGMLDITTIYNNRFTVPTVGKRVFVEIRTINSTGQASPLFQTSVIVVN